MHNSPFWNEDWMQTQQKYWQQWSDMSRQAIGLQKPPQSPWEAAMDHWWQAVAPQANNGSRDFMEKMLGQGKLFFRMGDSIAQNMQKGQDWSEGLNKAFEQLQHSFTHAASDAENNIQKWINLAQGPITQWQKFAGDLPSGLQGDNPFTQMLGTPGLGYTREDEDQVKQLIQASIEYQKKLLAYNQFFSDLGSESLQRMKAKIQALAEQEKTIDSGRAAYDLWVAASEEVYAERTMTPEYSVLHGELVNALMVVKKLWREMLDQKLGAMGMPTRRELRTLQTRFQASRREIRTLQNELKNTRKELEALKAEVAKLAKPAPAPATKPAATEKEAVSKKAPVKKKVAKKKAVSKKAASQ
jgi:class III poly(R)-hydroxyalkanoic acid synthase PhaE subunit